MKRILVVDDRVETTDLIKLILESSGYSCTTANSGRECLEILRNSAFDLIIFDLAMEGITGIDVLKRLKQEGILARNRILLLTASPTITDKDLEDSKHECKGMSIMSKPFGKKELLETITKMLA